MVAPLHFATLLKQGTTLVPAGKAEPQAHRGNELGWRHPQPQLLAGEDRQPGPRVLARHRIQAVPVAGTDRIPEAAPGVLVGRCL